MHTFTELGVPAALVDVLAQRGITRPFPIQAATIAPALAGRDLCGRAPTGSGKTLAFSIPLALRAGRGRPRRPAALVLVPTRELASQVAEELRPLAAAHGRSVATFFGGTTLSRDQRCLRHGVDIVVACPGRLADLVRRGDCDLSAVRLVVLDEADRMADMGFLPEVRRLLDATSPKRQTLLFSATLDGEVDVLVRRYQRDPVRHDLGSSADDAGDVAHLFWEADPTDRVRITGSAVRTVSSAIVFTRTKHGADRVARQLQRAGISAAAIHGNRSQRQRERALADFSAGRVTTLVATDVAARGIHVDAVGMVVHFDPPATDKDYVHRSGRTGRAGADGVVVTLVAPDKVREVQSLQRALSLPRIIAPVALEVLAPAATRKATARTQTTAARRTPTPPASGRRQPHPAGASTRADRRRGRGGGGRQRPARRP